MSKPQNSSLALQSHKEAKAKALLSQVNGYLRKQQLLEAFIFLEGGECDEKKLCKLMQIQPEELEKIAAQLCQSLQKRDSLLRIEKNHGLWQMHIHCPSHFSELRRYAKALLKKSRKNLKSSQIEILAIIAYKQPITKAEIESIRGTNSTKYIQELLQEDFIREAGKKMAPGNPVLYKTTKRFLHAFSLSSLQQLPALEDLKNYSFLSKKA